MQASTAFSQEWGLNRALHMLGKCSTPDLYPQLLCHGNISVWILQEAHKDGIRGVKDGGDRGSGEKTAKI